MKAEQRKALQTNTLANTLGTLNQKFKEGVSRNTLIVVGAIVVVVLLVWTWRHFAARSQSLNAQLWLRWDRLGDPEGMEQVTKELAKNDQLPVSSSERKELVDLTRLEDFTKKNPGTLQARMANFQRARLALYDGLRDLGMLSDRDRALKSLETAADTYQKLINESSDVPLLYQEALLNCGKAYESLGKINDAMGFYKRLQDQYPKSEYGKTAKNELDRLNDNKKDVEDLAKDLIDKPTPPKSLDVPK